ncbi:MAG: signal peptidase I [Ruminococcus sp.]|nr:signal peptidase I [Ruminococcus sp.]
MIGAFDMEDKKSFGEVDQKDIEKAAEAAPEDLREPQKVDIKDELLDWLESFVFAMFIVILIFTFIFRIVLVQGESMRDTLENGDRLIISHLNYTPTKGDIVVVEAKTSFFHKTIIKRVIGTGGDKVEINYNNNTVSVNGSVIKDDDKREVMLDTGFFDQGYKTDDGVYEYTVPKGKIFVMGDNRNNSTDSRRLGFIDEDMVLGKVVMRLYPFGKFGRV